MAPRTRNAAGKAARKSSARPVSRHASRKAKSTGIKRKSTSTRLGQTKKARARNLPPTNLINFHVPPGHQYPAWSTLPYEVLLSTFRFAAYPLIDEHWNRTPQVKWLLGAATACKSFTEPALAALYHGPPLVYQQEYLEFSHLMLSDKTHTIDYPSKVRQLDFEVNHIKFASFAADLGNLICRLPALRAFSLHQTADHPQPMNISRPQTTRAELIYRPDWIDSLAACHLTRFKFHSLLLPKSPLAQFGQWAFHGDAIRPSFKSLQKLEIAGCVDGTKGDRQLARAIQALPDLRHLSFLRCNFNEFERLAEEDMLIFQFPRNLSSLEFISCHALTSNRLTASLRSSGAMLRSLVLRSNYDTSLSFLTTLGQTCPNLTNLEYDLSLYSTSLVLSHAEPAFDEILSAGEIPSWPTTLQRIEFNQLRKWEPKTAEDFFNSLRDSAATLPDLRKLSIAASVGAGWRERVLFRERIINPIIDLFARGLDEADLPHSARKTPARRGSRTRNQHHPIHGKCDVVYIRVDNLRPAEEQMNESNFLDSEQSGDENYVE